MVTNDSIINQLGTLGRELGELSDLLGDAEVEAVKLRLDFERRESIAFLQAEGSVEKKKHIARLEAQEAEEEFLLADAKVRYLKTRIRVVETRIDIGRTLGATVRAELAALPGVEN
jgi:hypothetical protein